MKSRKILKKTLSAVLCAAMLVNPVIVANASELPYGVPRSPEITEDYMEGKIPATFYLWDVYKSKDRRFRFYRTLACIPSQSEYQRTGKHC